MTKSRPYKIASSLLLFAYINLMTLSIFHFHTVSSSSELAAVHASPISLNIPDPFSDGNSNCRVTLFTSFSYIGEKELCSQKPVSYESLDYSGLILSGNPLQSIDDSTSLRAPPFIL